MLNLGRKVYFAGYPICIQYYHFTKSILDLKWPRNAVCERLFPCFPSSISIPGIYNFENNFECRFRI
uniref:Uncharacterized protein n=1 Tax=Anguilla anguilla TaxID=7936 RepID=A0A0E9U6S0_ANGAN